jgi:hypothetical protein
LLVPTVVDVTSPTVTICSCLNSLSEGKVENITNHCSVQFETFIVPSITGFCISFVLHSCPCRRLCDFCDDPSVNSNRIPVLNCILASSPRESPRQPAIAAALRLTTPQLVHYYYRIPLQFVSPKVCFFVCQCPASLLLLENVTDVYCVFSHRTLFTV